MRQGLAGYPVVNEVVAGAGGGLPRAAVVVPLFEEGGQARVILTRRTPTLRTHRGEVSFPGGRVDPGESELEAALREAEEEVGLGPGDVEVVARLPSLDTVAGRYSLTPFVGLLAGRPRLSPNPAEVERAFDVALSRLLDEEVFREEHWERFDGQRSVYFFELEHDTVWGATARVLYNLLRAVTGT